MSLVLCCQKLGSYYFVIDKDRYLLTIHYNEEFYFFFFLLVQIIQKNVMENKKRETQSQIRIYIFFIKGKNLLAGSQQWGNNIFPWLFPSQISFLWFPYNYFIVPDFQGALLPIPLPVPMVI